MPLADISNATLETIVLVLAVIALIIVGRRYASPPVSGHNRDDSTVPACPTQSQRTEPPRCAQTNIPCCG